MPTITTHYKSSKNSLPIYGNYLCSGCFNPVTFCITVTVVNNAGILTSSGKLNDITNADLVNLSSTIREYLTNPAVNKLSVLI